MPLSFTWDARKAATNLKKHGVSFEEAATVFGDVFAMAIEDAGLPERTLMLGMSDRQRVLLVVHMEIGESIRVISARRATKHERRRYEEDA